MGFESKILNFIEKLGLDQRNYYQINNIHNSNLSDELIDKLLKLNIDAIYLFGKTPTLLFKFNPQHNKEGLQKTLLKSWNFDKAPILFYVTSSHISIYNAFIFPDKNKPDSTKIGTEDDIHEYHLNNISSEEFWEDKKKIFNGKNRINKSLLRNIVEAKKTLKHKNLDEKYIHSIIGRSLFLHYIADRQLIKDRPFENLESIFLNKDNLYNAFSLIKKHFNGDLFPVTEEEIDSVGEKHLQVLYTLFSGGEISTGQQSLFSYYDFSIIPIKLISNIYEKFLHEGDNKLQAYYTPMSTVDLVFEQLLDTEKIQNETFKILDPSCGSGIFLVTFLKKYFEKNPEKITPENVLNFVKNSLYGIDIDEDAIKITIFSLYITVLEFFEQPAIQAHDFKFPDLLNKNFFVIDFLNQDKKTQKKLGKFDYIVGNPPWGTIQESLKLYMNYCQKKAYPLTDKQIAQAFMYRVLDFMHSDTIVSLVIPSKILYNSSAKPFRDKFLSLFDVKAVIEMSLKRHKTFNAAIHPSAVLFYSNKVSKNDDNIFSHLTLHPSIFYDIFQMFIFSEENIKYVSQNEISKKDWLWKPLLYGSQFDIDLLKRLKKECTTTLNFLEDKHTNYGAGLIHAKSYSKSKPLEAEIYNEYKILLTEKTTNTFYPYHIDLSTSHIINKVFETNTFHDRGSINSYRAPHLLIKRGVSSSGVTIGVTNEVCTFKNSVFGVHINNLEVLNFLAALYSSDLYNYYLFMISSSWGVERPEVIMQEHRQLPIPKDISEQDILTLSNMYQQLSDLASSSSSIDGLFQENHAEIYNCKTSINKRVNKLFNLKKLDIKLIDYAVNNYPQISEHKTSKSQADLSDITMYINDFLDGIKIIFSKNAHHLHSYITIHERFIFIYFEKRDTQSIEVSNYTILDRPSTIHQHIMTSTFNLSMEEITTEIAFQRKIVGIDGNNFYLMKPNLKSTFHPLNAILDAKSFIEYWVHND